MLDCNSFHLIEYFSREDLDRHPVWRQYEESCDRERILAWGVEPETLDREVAKFRFCGSDPLYPVLDVDPLPAGGGLSIRVSYETRGGAALQGYVIEPHAFGLYSGDRELCLNRNLPAAARRCSEQLVQALGAPLSEIFPITYSSDFKRADGTRVQGELAVFW
jgi:hypothetical protein